jgi:nuclear migration protein JNM1
MLSLLSQSRHLDNISRRLKLIQPDLERISNASTPGHGSQSLSSSQRRQNSNNPLHSSIQSTNGAPSSTGQSTSVNKTHLEQLTPILTRLAPVLPNIPHILTRLRSLSALHTNAASFQATLEQLEAQQAKERADLADLEKALESIERSIKDNESVIKKNVENIEVRVDGVVRRIEDLQVLETF